MLSAERQGLRAWPVVDRLVLLGRGRIFGTSLLQSLKERVARLQIKMVCERLASLASPPHEGEITYFPKAAGGRSVSHHLEIELGNNPKEGVNESQGSSYFQTRPFGW